MLYLSGLRILEAPSGYKRINKKKVYHKWTNEEAENLPFDIFDNKEWKKYLKKFRLPNGKLLPRFTTEGELIVYIVYFFGSPKWVREMQNSKGAYYMLFPGRDSQGTELPVWKYGRID